MINKIKSYIFQGHEQSVSVKWNVSLSLFLKGINVVISLLLVPLLLKYLGKYHYGIWLTVSSILSWIIFFDIGLGGGLRVNLSEAFAKAKYKLAKIYTSTTYAVITLIITTVFITFLVVSPFLNWSRILNTVGISTRELKVFIFIVFFFTSVKFILQLLGIILIADQKPAIKNLIDTISRIIIFISMILLMKTSQKSLLYVGIIYTAIPVLIYILGSIYFFNKKKGIYYRYRPSLNSIKIKYFNNLAKLGGQFFIIRIAFIVLFTTDNIIITQLFGPQEVTTYNIAIKYFSTILMISTIVYLPLTSTYAHAYYKGDFNWIKRINKKILSFFIILSIVIIIMIIYSNFVYKIWIGTEIKIPLLLSFLVGISVIIQLIGTPFNSFLNATGKIKIQLLIAIFNIIVNIPLSIFLARNLNFGISGVIMATCICNLIAVIAQPIQFSLILKGKAKGIWN